MDGWMDFSERYKVANPAVKERELYANSRFFFTNLLMPPSSPCMGTREDIRNDFIKVICVLFPTSPCALTFKQTLVADK